jgi:hypothetical protein
VSRKRIVAAVMTTGMALTGAVSSVAPAEAHSTVTRKIVNDCTRVVARPGHIDWCGNTADRLVSLDWSSWGRHEARARGIARVNDCRPSCAEGTLHNYKATVRLHRDVKVNGHWRFLRMTIRFQSGRLEGERTTLRLPRKPY